jgi:hypothetical protein
MHGHSTDILRCTVTVLIYYDARSTKHEDINLFSCFNILSKYVKKVQISLKHEMNKRGTFIRAFYDIIWEKICIARGAADGQYKPVQKRYDLHGG